MHEIQRWAVALPAVAAVALAAAAARAAAGEPVEHHAVIGQVQPGMEVEGHGAYGFDPAYDAGFGGRLGYTLPQGVFLGGDVTHFVGTNGAPHETLLGADVGEKIFPTSQLEIRPYGFAGAAIRSVGKSALALAPGVVGAYHFGRAFIDLDARYMVTPTPNAFMLMGGGGVGF